MKNLLLLLTSFVIAISLNAQNLEFNPATPSPGDKVTVTYNPMGTTLEGASKIEATALLFNIVEVNAVEIGMKEEGGLMVGEFTASEDAKAIYVTFKDPETDTEDTNDENGYSTLVYDKDSGKPVMGANGSWAAAYANYGRFMGLKFKPESFMESMKTEFELYPDSQKEKSFLAPYAFNAVKVSDESAISMIESTVETLLSNKKASEEDLMIAHDLTRRMKKEAQMEEIAARITKKYPKGKFQRNQVTSSFYDAKELDEQIAILEKVRSWEDDSHKFSVNNFARRIASTYAKKEDWDNFNKYVDYITDNGTKASVMNSLAWPMCGGGLEGEAPNLEMAESFSAKSLKFVEAQMETLEGKPSVLTDKQWKKNLKRSYGMYADTYAVIKYRMEDYEEALHNQEIACKVNKFKDGEMNERYAVYFENAKGGAATIDVLEDFIRKGNASENMKAQYKRLFLAHQTLEGAYEKYMTSLEMEAAANLRAEMAKKMLNDPAPEFTLTNLEGKEVALADLKGKVVILDFWATWCGPCKASFPGMQMAVDKYKENEDVVFLFIDTWERDGQDKAANAAKFIESKEYTFNVLMDTEDKVVAKYSVDGIPTKFIIDGKGNIRFRDSGFSGNNEKLVDKLSLMIEMAGAKVEAELTGAP